MALSNYLTENDYKVVTCYNCQEKFFELSYEVKALNFCADCWNKKAVN